MTKSGPIYLGFSTSCHDPSIAVVEDNGEVVYAQSNERTLRSKRAWHSVPDALGVLVELLPLLGDRRVIASCTWSDKSLFLSSWIRRLLRTESWCIRNFFPNKSQGSYYGNVLNQLAMYKAPSSSKELFKNLEYRLWELGNTEELTRKSYNHHLTHAAFACYSSPFEEALCVVLDGMGEGGSLSVYEYQRGDLRQLLGPNWYNPASLGLLYGALTWACGFDPLWGEEWKVMGLAGYGTLDSKLHDLLRPMIEIQNCRIVQGDNYEKKLGELLELRGRYAALEQYADLAYTGQLVFEEVSFDLLQQLYARYSFPNLVLTGGCALNSSCNGKILRNTDFENLHIPVSPGDGGNSIGAAQLSWLEDNPGKPIPLCKGAYLGSTLSCNTGSSRLDSTLLKVHQYDKDDELVSCVANQLSLGKIVGWLQGRAEFGPRALGNRSILGDPRVPNLKARINSTIKFRESFRPCAPSILHEYGERYFKNYSYSPYMMKTFEVKEAFKQWPSILHVDGTARVQSVTSESNALFYKLLREFHELTGVPCLLNTSFNVMGRPIVHDYADAYTLFCTTKLDCLVVDRLVYTKG